MPITYRYHQDTRDGTIYPCVLMPDGQWWSAENLRWAGAGTAYNNDPAMEAIYGRLYSYADAITGCPPGTHLPTGVDLGGASFWGDWGVLKRAITAQYPNVEGRTLKANSALWSINTGTDNYGFAGLPGGRASPAYNGVGLTSEFWSADMKAGSSTVAYTAVLYHNTASIGFNASIISSVMASIRFIVDVFNEPHPVKLFGVNFDGFERGMSVTIKRAIDVVDSIGGPPRLVPYGPAIVDEWRVETELWVNAERASALEAAVPPYGSPSDASMLLPPRGGLASFPGLLPALAGASADRYDHAQVTRFESQGRKGPALDLYGYFLDFTIRCWGGGAETNPAIAPTVMAPTWLEQKFAAHQFQDWSSQEATYTAGGAATTYLQSRHGRRRDVNLNLDHLTQGQADQLVALFRGVRNSPVTVSIDTGPDGIASVSVYLIGLQLHRTGLHWDGTLETILA